MRAREREGERDGTHVQQVLKYVKQIALKSSVLSLVLPARKLKWEVTVLSSYQVTELGRPYSGVRKMNFWTSPMHLCSSFGSSVGSGQVGRGRGVSAGSLESHPALSAVTILVSGFQLAETQKN